MQIGIPAETVAGETRVAATPDTVKKLASAGHTVVVERGAGVAANYIDSAYEQAGAKLTDDAYAGSQIILKVRAPQGDAIQKLAANAIVIAMFDPYRNPELDAFAAQQVNAYALELLPRTLSRAQNMDVLSSQSNLNSGSSVTKRLETSTRASSGHRKNQSMVVPLIKAGNRRARSANFSLAGEKHKTM